MYFCIQFDTAQYSCGKLHVFGQICVTDLVWHPPLHPVLIQMNVVHTHIYDIHLNSFSLLSTLLSLSCFFLSSCFQTKLFSRSSPNSCYLPYPTHRRLIKLNNIKRQAHHVVFPITFEYLSFSPWRFIYIKYSPRCNVLKRTSFRAREKRERESFTRIFVKSMKQNPSWSLSASIKPGVQYRVHNSPQTPIADFTTSRYFCLWWNRSVPIMCQVKFIDIRSSSSTVVKFFFFRSGVTRNPHFTDILAGQASFSHSVHAVRRC